MTDRRSRHRELRSAKVPLSELHPGPQKQPDAPADNIPPEAHGGQQYYGRDETTELLRTEQVPQATGDGKLHLRRSAPSKLSDRVGRWRGPQEPAEDEDGSTAAEPLARYQQAARILGEAAIRVAERDGPIGVKKK